nr:hypothetical protein [Tanacetum cinerariifolium]
AKIKKLQKRVKKLEGKKNKRTRGLKILCKVGLSARIVSSDKEGLGDQKDASKQGRIAEIDADEDLSLINETAQDQGRMNEENLFGVHDLDGDEVIMDVTACENVKQDVTVAEKEVSIADDEVVTTAKDVEVVATATTLQISKDDVTLAQTLMEIKAAKPKKSFDAIKKFFNKVYKRVNTFVDMNTKIMEEMLKKTQAEVTKGSSKKARDEIEQESAKSQRLEKEDDTLELKRCLKIVPEDYDDVTIEATPLSSKSPTIVDYKC